MAARELERIAALRGYLVKLRIDNGPDPVSLALAEWAEQHGVTLKFIKPGKPVPNGFIERSLSRWTSFAPEEAHPLQAQPPT